VPRFRRGPEVDSTDACSPARFGRVKLETRRKPSTARRVVQRTLLTDYGTLPTRIRVIRGTLLTKLIAKTINLQLACVSRVPLALAETFEAYGAYGECT
jgi:hypothetical protein